MPNNILQFDVNKNDIMSVIDYLRSSSRINGYLSGINSSNINNRIFYQISTMMAALGAVMSAKGYTIRDANITALVLVLSKIMTKADMASYSTTVQMRKYVNSHVQALSFSRFLGNSGFQSIPSGITGQLPLIMQWAVGVWDPADHSEPIQTIVFPIQFPTNCLFAKVSTQIEQLTTSTKAWYKYISTTKTMIIVQRHRNSHGDITKRTRPLVFAIGY
jgi:hypothetical protein